MNASPDFALAVVAARETGKDERTFRLWLREPVQRAEAAHGQGARRQAEVCLRAAVTPKTRNREWFRARGLQLPKEGTPRDGVNMHTDSVLVEMAAPRADIGGVEVACLPGQRSGVLQDEHARAPDAQVSAFRESARGIQEKGASSDQSGERADSAVIKWAALRGRGSAPSRLIPRSRGIGQADFGKGGGAGS